MRFGLVSYECRNKDLAFNLHQIERAMKDSTGKVDMLCFGESFLQGFDCLCWNYEIDRFTALEQDSESIRQLQRWTEQYKLALLTGYIEKYQDKLFSSCFVIDDGEIIHNYRRISRGWKDFHRTDGHYHEGEKVQAFSFHGKEITITLCGDMWDYPERFKTEHLLIWPVYVTYTIKEWKQRELQAYAEQAQMIAGDVLMINPIDHPSGNHGGAFFFQDGKITSRLPFDQEGILIVDVA